MTIIRPIAGGTDGAWTATGAATTHEAVDEVSASLADYASVASTGSTLRLKLATISTPLTTGHSFDYQISSDTARDIRVRFLENTTVLAEETKTLVSATPTIFNMTFDGTIGDGSDLWFEIMAMAPDWVQAFSVAVGGVAYGVTVGVANNPAMTGETFTLISGDGFAVASNGDLSVTNYELLSESSYPTYTVVVRADDTITTTDRAVYVTFDGDVMFDNGFMLVGPDNLPIYG